MPNISKPADMSSIWASAGNSVAPSAAKIAQGWVVELPPYQTANFIANKQDSFNAHTNQHGIPVWDSATEYQGGVSYSKGSNGVIYKCLATNTGLDPTNPNNSSSWARAFEDFGSVAVVSANLAALDTQYRTLTGLSNITTARNNLDVYSRTEMDARYARRNGEVGQVFSVANATQPAHAIPLSQLNTLLVSATETVKGIAEIASASEMVAGTDDERIVTPKKVSDNFLRRSNNLSDITNAAQARANLGLFAATETISGLSEIASDLEAAGTTDDSRTMTPKKTAANYLRRANNLADLSDAATARTNLGLSAIAIMSIGTTAGTVAAGNDSRIVNAVQNTRNVIAGNGLVGGGSLGSDVTITMGTPGTVSGNTGNAVAASSHTHNVAYAQPTVGGVVKMRMVGTTLYIRNDGGDA